MFYLVRKPTCSLEALTNEATDAGRMELVATAERQANPDQDIWDYTEWRLFADHSPTPEEVLAECRKHTEALSPEVIDFVALWPGARHPATTVLERYQLCGPSDTF
jgi:hypothetical protein